MSGYRLHDRIALIAALVVPFATALALVPFRTDLSATNAALVTVVAVVAVAAAGTRAAGALAALSAAAWLDFFLTRPYQRFTIAGRDDVETARLAGDCGSPEAVVAHVRRELVPLLGLRGCRFEYGTLTGRLPRLEHDASLRLRRAARDTVYDAWSEGETELRVVGGGRYYDRFLLDPVPGPLPPEDARLVAVALAAQAGAALDTAGLARSG